MTACARCKSPIQPGAELGLGRVFPLCLACITKAGAERIRHWRERRERRTN